MMVPLLFRLTEFALIFSFLTTSNVKISRLECTLQGVIRNGGPIIYQECEYMDRQTDFHLTSSTEAIGSGD